MSEIAIRVKGIAKQYKIGGQRERYKTLRESLASTARWPLKALRSRRQTEQPVKNENFWALKNISFEIEQGEIVGVIGRNGAGKSTLLKILSRITEPTAGYAEVYGRIGSLLEVGTGFHPELSGRENIFLNGAILGMRRDEIAGKFDEIVEFAEVSKFIDTPVKHYSSGMYLRLAFAVAAHLEPEVLLVDEVLAVGDTAFQKKCLGKMREVACEGRTVLFISHDMTAISQLSSRTLLLANGSVDFMGEPSEVINRYLTSQQTADDNLGLRTDREGDGLVRLEEVRFFNADAKAVNSVPVGAPLSIVIGFSSRLDQLHLSGLVLDVRLTDMMGHPITTFSTRFGSVNSSTSVEQRATLCCYVPSLTLAEDTYLLDLWLSYRGGLSDFVRGAAQLDVTAYDYFGTGRLPTKRKHGAALIKHEWTVTATRNRQATLAASVTEGT